MLYELEISEDVGQVSQRARLAIHVFFGLCYGFVAGLVAISILTF